MKTELIECMLLVWYIILNKFGH